MNMKQNSSLEESEIMLRNARKFLPLRAPSPTGSHQALYEIKRYPCYTVQVREGDEIAKLHMVPCWCDSSSSSVRAGHNLFLSIVGSYKGGSTVDAAECQGCAGPAHLSNGMHSST